MNTNNQYFTPRTHIENEVFEEQAKHKVKMVSFLALSVSALGAAPILGVGILGVGALSAGIYCTGKLYESYKLSTENLNLFHSMKKEKSIHSKNYKELTEVAEVINNNKSTIGDILLNIKKLRHIEKIQSNNSVKPQ